MIQLPKNLLRDIKDGISTEKELINHLQTYPLNEILKAFAELLITSEVYINQPQISVSEEEYRRITSLFRVKGQRMLDGVIAEETRGRKPKIQKG